MPQAGHRGNEKLGENLAANGCRLVSFIPYEENSTQYVPSSDLEDVAEEALSETITKPAYEAAVFKGMRSRGMFGSMAVEV